MTISQTILALMLTFVSVIVFAGAPTAGSPLPTLSIAERGELTMAGDDFKFVSWSSDQNPGKVHVIQYFGATIGDRDVFKPFTDLLQTSFEPGAIHVTTVLNLDAALWGTTGFVVSELKKNKKVHPQATMVLDEDGTGVEEWGLGKDGTGLVVVDEKGVVKFFSHKSLESDEMTSTVELIRATISS